MTILRSRRSCAVQAASYESLPSDYLTLPASTTDVPPSPCPNSSDRGSLTICGLDDDDDDGDGDGDLPLAACTIPDLT